MTTPRSWYTAIMYWIVLFQFDRLFVECLIFCNVCFTKTGRTEAAHRMCIDVLNQFGYATYKEPDQINFLGGNCQIAIHEAMESHLCTMYRPIERAC